MPFPLFLSGVMALLLAPGTTNTLIALSAASGGLRNALRLLPAELAGYLVMVLPLAMTGAVLMERWPFAGTALTAAAALWLFALALRLWHRAAMMASFGAITARTMFCTTVLNPKALVFGLVLLPPVSSADFGPRLIAFAVAVITAGLVWAAGGTLVGRNRGRALSPDPAASPGRGMARVRVPDAGFADTGHLTAALRSPFTARFGPPVDCVHWHRRRAGAIRRQQQMDPGRDHSPLQARLARWARSWRPRGDRHRNHGT